MTDKNKKIQTDRPTVLLEITSCSKCPNFKRGNSYSTDGFDRGEDWFCTKMDDKMIAGFVEWRDDPKIPDWCPIQVQDKPKKKKKPEIPY